MMDHASASATAISKGSRYSSRRVVSSTTLSTVLRSVSDSLATRCLRHAPTRLSCRPRTYAAASLPVSSGSSEYDSNSRPPSRERCRLIVGPRTTWIRCAIASSASSRPTSYALSSLQAEASRVAFGNRATVRPWWNFSPRTPVGPSDRRTSARPIASHGARVNAEAPVSRFTLSRRSRAAINAAYSVIVPPSTDRDGDRYRGGIGRVRADVEAVAAGRYPPLTGTAPDRQAPQRYVDAHGHIVARPGLDAGEPDEEAL